MFEVPEIEVKHAVRFLVYPYAVYLEIGDDVIDSMEIRDWQVQVCKNKKFYYPKSIVEGFRILLLEKL